MDKPRRSRQGTGQRAVGEVLAAVIARHKLGGGVRRVRPLVAWSETVGPALARTTRAVTVRDGVLIVETQDAVAANFLSMQRTVFLDRLRERLGAAAPKDILFQMGVFDPPPPQPAPPPPLPPADARRVDEMTRGAPEDLLPVVRRAAEAVARGLGQRAARGWPPCPVCEQPVDRPGPCQPCRTLMTDPRVRDLRLALVRRPELLLDPLCVPPDCPDEHALEAARYTALEYLEAQLDALLLHVVRPAKLRGRRSQEPDPAAQAEYRAYLDLAARAYLALKLRRPLSELGRKDREVLPERVRHVLDATDALE